MYDSQVEPHLRASHDGNYPILGYQIIVEKNSSFMGNKNAGNSTDQFIIPNGINTPNQEIDNSRALINLKNKFNNFEFNSDLKVYIKLINRINHEVHNPRSLIDHNNSISKDPAGGNTTIKYTQCMGPQSPEGTEVVTKTAAWHPHLKIEGVDDDGDNIVDASYLKQINEHDRTMALTQRGEQSSNAQEINPTNAGSFNAESMLNHKRFNW